MTEDKDGRKEKNRRRRYRPLYVWYGMTYHGVWISGREEEVILVVVGGAIVAGGSNGCVLIRGASRASNPGGRGGGEEEWDGDDGDKGGGGGLAGGANVLPRNGFVCTGGGPSGGAYEVGLVGLAGPV
ncbi:hypothetical protein FRC16_008164, partial [Serendipita sp. 398]